MSLPPLRSPRRWVPGLSLLLCLSSTAAWAAESKIPDHLKTRKGAESSGNTGGERKSAPATSRASDQEAESDSTSLTADASSDEEKSESDKPKNRMGSEGFEPFVIHSDDGQQALRIAAAAQLRGTYTSEVQDIDFREASSSLEFQRLRLTTTASFFGKTLGFKLQLNLAPKALELIDLYATYRYTGDLAIQFGQQKIPYTIHREQSFALLVLDDWGEATRFNGAERQLGVQLFNRQGGPTGLDYAFGIFHGQNSRAAFNTRLARSYGETLGNPSSLTDSIGYGSVHPEFVGRLAYNRATSSWWTTSDESGGELRDVYAISGTYDLNPQVANDATIRLAAETLLKYKGWGLSALFYLSWVTLSEYSPPQNTPLGTFGPQVELAYRLNRHIEFAGRFSMTQITQSVRQDAESRASAMIAAANSSSERDALANQYRGAGQLVREAELTLGFNYYIFGSSLKWQTDASWLPVELTTFHHNDYRVRSQVQLVY